VEYTDYEEYPRTLPRDDFWGQVRRTIYGRRVTEEELTVIIEAIKDGLRLSKDDTLLDLACGNGAMTARLFGSCRSVLGVDLSSYLIEIAKEYFERPPQYGFAREEIVTYVRSEPEPDRFTKVMCYGSLPLLAVDAVQSMLTELRRRFPNLERILLGNLPDKERAHLFFGEDFEQLRPNLSDPTSQIGVWWSQNDLAELAAACGWKAGFSQLPTHIFNAHYRYDAVLQPDGSAAPRGV
jgi:SAM-dependent methyltransferase